jgi:hypothetical protein
MDFFTKVAFYHWNLTCLFAVNHACFLNGTRVTVKKITEKTLPNFWETESKGYPSHAAPCRGGVLVPVCGWFTAMTLRHADTANRHSYWHVAAAAAAAASSHARQKKSRIPMLQHCIPWNMRGGRLLFASLTALPLMARLVAVMLFAVPIAATGVAEVVHNAPRGFLGRHRFFWVHVGMLLLLMMPVAGKKRQAPEESEPEDSEEEPEVPTAIRAAKKSAKHRAAVSDLKGKFELDLELTKRQLAVEEGATLKKNMEKLKRAAKLYHTQNYGEELACKESGLATKSQLQKHNTFLRKKYSISNVRNLSWAVYFRDVVWRSRGRGDSPTVEEMQMMVEQFGLKCKNVKDTPQSEIWKSVVHEVLEKSRGSQFVKKQNYSDRFYSDLAKTLDLTIVSLDRVANSRANAIGDWKNVISTIACWLACIIKFRIQPKYVYSMDDTTMFLEEKQVKQRGIVPKAVAAAARALGLRFSLSLKEKKKKTGTHAQRTIKLLAVVSAAGNLVCTIVKITDYAIASSELYRLRPGLYVAMMKGHSKSAVSEEERQARRASTLQFTSRMLVGAVIPSIKQDMILSEHKTKVRIIDDNGDSQPVPGEADLHPEDAGAFDLAAAPAVLPRAVLTFDGDFPQIAALMQERVRDGDFEFDENNVMSPSRRETGLARAPSVAERFAASNIELFKWCAGCSLLHQPLDRSRCFYCLKSALRGSSAFTYRDIQVVAEHGGASPYIESFITHQLLKTKIPADSKRSFQRFLLNVEPLCQYAFSSPNIREGFHSTGIACASLTSSHCINIERIFASYGFMSVTITASHAGNRRLTFKHRTCCNMTLV